MHKLRGLLLMLLLNRLPKRIVRLATACQQRSVGIGHDDVTALLRDASEACGLVLAIGVDPCPTLHAEHARLRHGRTVVVDRC